jgi:hypothetical protein
MEVLFMPSIPFDEVWERISAHQSEVFYEKEGTEKNGREFLYVVIGDQIEISRDRLTLNLLPLKKANFEKAYNAMPVDGPSGLPKDVMGPSYVWGILSDTRISHREW